MSIKKIQTEFNIVINNNLDNYEDFIVTKNDDFRGLPHIKIGLNIERWRTYDDTIEFYQNIVSKLITHKDEICK